jgi:hypothetical protein
MVEENRGDEQWQQLLEQIRQDASLPERLIGAEADIVRSALDGQDIHEIAQQQRLPEEEIWTVLGNVARLVRGQPGEPIESGGLGSDTDPGTTGGYGDTAFGSIGNEPPIPTPEEPDSETPEEK